MRSPFPLSLFVVCVWPSRFDEKDDKELVSLVVSEEVGRPKMFIYLLFACFLLQVRICLRPTRHRGLFMQMVGFDDGRLLFLVGDVCLRVLS